MNKINLTRPMVHCRAIGLVFLIFVVSLSLPIRWLENTPLCFIRWMTGFSCPGCGLTRSFVHFFHGNFIQSFSMNILGPLMILWLIYYAFYHALLLKKQGGLSFKFNTKFNKIFSYCFILLFFGQWLFKLFLNSKINF